MIDRTSYVEGKLDEVVVCGGARLEYMGGKRWLLSLRRANGSEICLWFSGKIDMVEERSAPE